MKRVKKTHKSILFFCFSVAKKTDQKQAIIYRQAIGCLANRNNNMLFYIKTNAITVPHVFFSPMYTFENSFFQPELQGGTNRPFRKELS